MFKLLQDFCDQNIGRKTFFALKMGVNFEIFDAQSAYKNKDKIIRVSRAGFAYKIIGTKYKAFKIQDALKMFNVPDRPKNYGSTCSEVFGVEKIYIEKEINIFEEAKEKRPKRKRCTSIGLQKQWEIDKIRNTQLRM